MRISYDEQVDALYIRLLEGDIQCRTVRLSEVVALNIGPKEQLVGIEILDAKETHPGDDVVSDPLDRDLRHDPARDPLRLRSEVTVLGQELPENLARLSGLEAPEQLARHRRRVLCRRAEEEDNSERRTGQVGVFSVAADDRVPARSR